MDTPGINPEPPSSTWTEDNIGITTISNPPAHSLSEGVVAELLAAFDRFEREQVRVIIIRGEPGSKI